MNATPLGGIGSSGMGSYHGYYSIKAFSHQRVIATVPYWADKLLRVRYMPYSESELARFQRMSQSTPNFDRNGDVVKGFKYYLGLLFSLGGKSASGSVARWVVLLAVAAFLRVRRE